MNFYPLAPKSIMTLVHASIARYTAVLKATILLIVLADVLKDLPFYFGELPQHHALRLILIGIAVASQVYLWAAILQVTHSLLKGKVMNYREACGIVWAKISGIFSTFFAYLLGFCFVFFMGYFVAKGVSLYVLDNTLRGVVVLLLVGLPITLYCLGFFFAPLLSVLEPIALWQAFYESIALAWNRNLWRVFVVYAAVILLGLVVFPGTPHEHLLEMNHLSFLFDLVILILFGPLAAVFVLLALNDLRLRWRLANVAK